MRSEPLQMMSKKEIANVAISFESCIARIKECLTNRRRKGELGEFPEVPKVYIAVKNCNWEKSGIVDSWGRIGDVVHYDWGSSYDQYSSDWHHGKKTAFCNELYNRVLNEHNAGKIHIFFSYLSGRLVFPETISKIRELGIITINFDYDDTFKFWGFKEPSGLSGSAEICSSFDICISAQSESNIGKYIAVGANPIFLPSGGNPETFASSGPYNDRTIDVSFVGQKYGQRETMINFLRKNGVAVTTRGEGWSDGPVSTNQMLEIFRKSLVTLGFGFIDESNAVALKGRDFEVPMTGTAYLTTYNVELGKYFMPDKEIFFYKNQQELLRKVKYLLSNRSVAIEAGLAARTRALAEHTWQHRWHFLIGLCR